MDLKIEVLVLPVSDVDRAIAVYRDQAGFTLDVDYQPTPDFRVVQFTPPGSAASLHLEEQAEPFETHTTYLTTDNLVETLAVLSEKGLDVTEVSHKVDPPNWRGDMAPGIDPERLDYSSIAVFSDPDGHRWVVQEKGYSPDV